MTATPSARLRAAAEVLRERAGAATPGPWRAHDTWLNEGGYAGAVLHTPPGGQALLAWVPSFTADPGGYRQQVVDAQWIALMSPAIAEPMAHMFECCADRWDALDREHRRGGIADHRPSFGRDMLAIADALLPHEEVGT